MRLWNHSIDKVALITISHSARVGPLDVALLSTGSISKIHLRNIKTRTSVGYARYQRAMLCPEMP